MAVYARSLDWSLRHPVMIMLVMVMTIAASAALYRVKLPKGFMPTQDTGILRVRTITIANVSFAAMEQLQRTVANAILADPAVSGLTSYIGADNGTTLSSRQHHRRPQTAGPAAGLDRPGGQPGCAPSWRRSTGVRTFFIPLQDLNLGVGNSASSRYQYTLSGQSPEEVFRWEEAMRRRMNRMPEVTDVISSLESSGLEAGLTIDRVAGRRPWVSRRSRSTARCTTRSASGRSSTLYLPSNYSRVILEVDPQTGTDPGVFADIYVPGVAGAQVPMASLVRPFRAHAAMWVIHTDQFPSATISFDTCAAGASLGDAIAAINVQPSGSCACPTRSRPGSRARRWRRASRAASKMAEFAGAVIAVYIVLGMLYESFAHPLTILSTLPSAVFGALLALRVTGFQFTLIASIACVLLVGMVMKNAIMMVDFALELQREPRPVAARCGAGGGRAARPADHHDDAGGDPERPAAGIGHRAWPRVASTTGDRECGRSGRLANPDALHHAGDLPPDCTPDGTVGPAHYNPAPGAARPRRRLKQPRASLSPGKPPCGLPGMLASIYQELARGNSGRKRAERLDTMTCAKTRDQRLGDDAMDFQMTEQHVAIDEGVRKVCAGFDDAYWTECEEKMRFPQEYYAAMAAGGWLGITMPESLGRRWPGRDGGGGDDACRHVQRRRLLRRIGHPHQYVRPPRHRRARHAGAEGALVEAADPGRAESLLRRHRAGCRVGYDQPENFRHAHQ